MVSTKEDAAQLYRRVNLATSRKKQVRADAAYHERFKIWYLWYINYTILSMPARLHASVDAESIRDPRFQDPHLYKDRDTPSVTPSGAVTDKVNCQNPT